MEIQQIINEIILDVGAGKSVAKKLTAINSDTEALTAWVYETNQFVDDFVLIIHRGNLVEAFDDYCDGYLSEEEKNELTDDDLWNFLISNLEDENCISLHFTKVGDICLTCEAESMGQGGFHFSSFGLHESGTTARESYKNLGYYLYDDPMPSKAEVVKLLRQRLNT
jgi:hypothetical protein